MDTHVIKSSNELGWVLPTTDADQVRRQLESWVPKLFWADFNEVYGCLGQLFSQRSLHPKIKSVVGRAKFASISGQIHKLMASYVEKKKKKVDKKKKATPKASPKASPPKAPAKVPPSAASAPMKRLPKEKNHAFMCRTLHIFFDFSL